VFIKDLFEIQDDWLILHCVFLYKRAYFGVLFKLNTNMYQLLKYVVDKYSFNVFNAVWCLKYIIENTK